ncbi:hypothetical protein [Muriicola soli]|uniref:Lipocalin-like domain-containing protein n=1 Tax=Muriicola soli TaxID=2507538 RepID=A0A411EC42_9FLAO|nr:hypothetical protein [Muriicola soli]QBA65316.1 hypothetical protein EQY75_12715 [Muriicola soli]
MMSRLLPIVLLLLFSCGSSNDPLQNDSWVLNSTYAYMTQTEQMAAELNYTEKVAFISDGLFLKSQTRDGETTTIEGRWVANEQNGNSGFRVTYAQNHPLIRNCFVEPEEFYFFSGDLLIQSDFTPCDGPEYRYVRSPD